MSDINEILQQVIDLHNDIDKGRHLKFSAPKSNEAKAAQHIENAIAELNRARNILGKLNESKLNRIIKESINKTIYKKKSRF